MYDQAKRSPANLSTTRCRLRLEMFDTRFLQAVGSGASSMRVKASIMEHESVGSGEFSGQLIGARKKKDTTVKQQFTQT